MERERARPRTPAVVMTLVVRVLVYGIVAILWLLILCMVDEGIAVFLDSAAISPCSRNISDDVRHLLGFVDMCKWLPVAGIMVVLLTARMRSTSVAVALLALHCLAFFAMQAAVMWAILGLFALATP